MERIVFAGAVFSGALFALAVSNATDLEDCDFREAFGRFI